MIDLHCHLLPGVDDGPGNIASAIEQARAHVDAGVTTVACTPHVSHDHRNTASSIEVAIEAFRASLTEADVPLSLLAGAEVSLSRAVEVPDEELSHLHLGSSGWLLLEPPLASEVPRLRQLVSGIASRGHRILIAHPERCAAFHRDGDLLAAMVKDGALVQLTAGSLSGHFGRTVQKLAMAMIHEGLVHVIASDAHDPVQRPPGLAGPLADAKLDALVEWTTYAVPSAMLSGEAIPPRPQLPRSSVRHRYFRRR